MKIITILQCGKYNLIRWGKLTSVRRLSLWLLITLKPVKYHRMIVGEIAYIGFDKCSAHTNVKHWHCSHCTS